jgi:leader peptidase (prepilin peptidase) / N-methyltransferase
VVVTWPILLILGLGLFAIGTVVGSFLNVCINRIPWQKSVIWPGSRCPKCLHAIAVRDNIPIVGWFALRGECRTCGAPIAARYPLVEALVGLLFIGVYLIDIVYGPRTAWGEIPAEVFLSWFYHSALVALLVVATFIDYDLTLIPDQITVTGMVIGLTLGTLWPAIRPEPATASTHAGGFWVGMIGLLVGGGLTWFVRVTGSLALRREAMGVGDVTLMGMIGAFLSWRAAVMTFFLAPFFGLAHALWKLVRSIGKRLSGAPSSSSDREIPFGPYLSMAAVALLLSWPWLWPNWAKSYFATLSMLFWWMLGVDH